MSLFIARVRTCPYFCPAWSPLFLRQVVMSHRRTIGSTTVRVGLRTSVQMGLTQSSSQVRFRGTLSPVTKPYLPRRNCTADNQKYRCAVVQLTWIINVLTHSSGFPAQNQSVLTSMLTGAHFLPSLYNQYDDQSTFSTARINTRSVKFCRNGEDA